MTFCFQEVTRPPPVKVCLNEDEGDSERLFIVMNVVFTEKKDLWCVGFLLLKFAFLRMKEKPGATTVVFPGKNRNNKKKLKLEI